MITLKVLPACQPDSGTANNDDDNTEVNEYTLDGCCFDHVNDSDLQIVGLILDGGHITEECPNITAVELAALAAAYVEVIR